MTSQHTPGPWVATRNDAPWLGFMIGAPVSDTLPAHAPRHIGNAYAEADARLIAEAPRTLAALEQLLDTMEPPRSRKASEAWDAAHAAVRRARAVAD
jgi:hypothetical protein